VHWSVRGIFDGYVGWFDGNASTMFVTPPQAVHPEVVALAGGAGPVAARAQALADGGDPEGALHLADVALAAEPDSQAALEARLAALEALLAASRNINEAGWLNAAIIDVTARLAALGP